MKKCIKVRIPTSEGWKTVRMEKKQYADEYLPIPGYDTDIASAEFGGDVFYVSDKYKNTVEYLSKMLGAEQFEVTWQGDEWD